MRYAIRLAGAITATILLGSCSNFVGHSEEAPKTVSTAPVQPSVSDLPVKVGTPFTVAGTTYTPVDVANYDEVGYASYYGAELAGRPTANGEVFLPSGFTAAHKTLAMPRYVEVTALDTGRTILVRVNDRGPFSNDRVIDLSEGAAKQLGITAQGVAGVRVRKVNPPEQERAVLRSGLAAAERIETPESLLRVLRDKLAKLPRSATSSSTSTKAVAPTKPVVSTKEVIAPSKAKPVAATSHYSVQIGAFSSRSHADALAKKAGANVIASADGRLFRVRLGPYSSEAEAKSGLTGAKQRGYSDAKLIRD